MNERFVAHLIRRIANPPSSEAALLGRRLYLCEKRGDAYVPFASSPREARDLKLADDREAWLLSPVSSLGRATIDVAQYEELRKLACRALATEFESHRAVAEEEKRADCPRCGGRGFRLTEMEQRCHECGGRGKVRA